VTQKEYFAELGFASTTTIVQIGVIYSLVIYVLSTTYIYSGFIYKEHETRSLR
jgi:hypothetical protein